MARQVFVSYKYADSGVRAIYRNFDQTPTTARHYVDVLESHLDANDHIYKGENDGESLADFKDETIESKLKERIFYSSTTIVLISKNMMDRTVPEHDQWIPWEVSYSLREITRGDRTSTTNAMLAVVLPDENGSYDYFVAPVPGCGICGCTYWKKESLFNILGENMFNLRQPNESVCPNGVCGAFHVGADHSYIYPVIWDEFITDINTHIDHAWSIMQNKEKYSIKKRLD